jgi:hypothetical protein
MPAEPREPPEPGTELAGSWIWHFNLRRFLELVSFYAGYSFDDSDWLAVEAGLQELNGENETFVYPIMGRPELRVSLSTDPGSGAEVTVRITGRPDRILGARISGLIDAYQHPSGPFTG